MAPSHTTTNTTMERIILAVLLTVIVSCSARPKEQIVGGSNAQQCEFPHMVFVDIKTKDSGSLCGGTLISDKWVLTAAHCVKADVVKIEANLGSTHKFNASKVIKVKQWIPHPKFRRTNTLINDIALLELEEKVPFTKCIASLDLPNKGDTFDGTCIAVGWGKTEKEGILPDHLQKTRINVMPTSQCQKTAPGISAQQHICVGDNTPMGKNVCGGDSGGGLVCQRKSDNVYVVAGVASYVLDCNKGLGIYANAASFVDYIKGYVNL